MPWGVRKVEDIREEFVTFALRKAYPIAKLCRIYKISRKTGYKWIKRALEGDSLTDRSRRPLRTKNKTPVEIEEKIINLRMENPGWGARKLYHALNKEIELPSIKTINNILNRNGLILEEESQKRKHYRRFEREAPNELWQADFKGEFRLKNGQICYPLTVIDDCSRYSIAIVPKENQRGIKDEFEKILYEYGKPRELLTDNGWCFRGYKGSCSKFEKWLMDHDILPIHGRIMHPQTQGKVERFHKTMEDELLKHREFRDIEEFKDEVLAWKEKYNNVRPHEALDNKCPAQVYEKSALKYDPTVKPYDYDYSLTVKKANKYGYILLNGNHIFVSETLAKHYLAVQPDSENENIVNIIYRNYQIGKIDLVNSIFIPTPFYRMR
jgi:transposase InsO family protein